ncbi:uncharacterized protein LOC122830156 isoform X3 [Gambusia affinis]|uniref:uncharacterized protein LOC122830156 isoform X3 n=1 Tax=Gambusia affinis TaxID=33528 RepID=UPI001CDC6D7E|nr:uncharacterized protein LOC122830156 isoform X3 [Gambusia affinis]
MLFSTFSYGRFILPSQNKSMHPLLNSSGAGATCLLFCKHQDHLTQHGLRQSEAMPRGKYERRIQTDRSTMTFTISNLTVNDEGIYKCVFKKTDKVFVSCSIYGVFITETKSCPMMPPTKDSTFVVPRTTLMLFIILICVISVLAMWIFFLLITPRVKQWCIRRRAGGDQKVSTDNVYEIMSRNARGQAAA